MITILIVILILLFVFSGPWGGRNWGYGPPGIVGVILIILLILLLTGRI